MMLEDADDAQRLRPPRVRADEADQIGDSGAEFSRPNANQTEGAAGGGGGAR